MRPGDWLWQACPKCKGTVAYDPARIPEGGWLLLNCNGCGQRVRVAIGRLIEEVPAELGPFPGG